MIRRFAANSLAEVRELGRKLYDLAKGVAPSIVLFTEASDFDAKTYQTWEKTSGRGVRRASPGAGPAVSLVEATPDGDAMILAALLHTTSGLSFKDRRTRVKSLARAARRELMKKALEHMEFYDVPPREFEYADLTFELVLSASCFAQLKRHRMATLTAQDYDPALGVTVPPAVEVAGAEKEFAAIIERTNDAYDRLRRKAGPVAGYVLANAHRRRALLKVNVRELYHISRLREDATAQWEIRELSAGMSRSARTVMPLAGLLLGGKDAYPRLYEKVFGKSPRAVPPDVKE